MYKLVIIDDEKEQVEGVMKIIDWVQHEITICGTADNGEKGLALIEATLPDIAIIDIKMPLLGGLEMLEAVNKRGINLQSIILSGYDDFYFAQKAIELQTTNYLLKPCRPEQILQSVLKAKNLISAKKRRSAVLHNYHELIRNNIPILKERLLKDLLKGNLHDAAVLKQKLISYGMAFSELTHAYCAVIFNGDWWPEGQSPAWPKADEYLMLAVMDTIKQGLTPRYRCETLYESNQVIVILEVTAEDDYRLALAAELEKLKRQINQQYDLSMTIGIGGPVSPLAAVGRSYQQAATAVETGFFSGENQVIFYDPQMSVQSSKFLYPFQEIKQIIRVLEKGDEEMVPAAVGEFFQAIAVAGKPAKGEIQKLSMTLLSNILHFCVDQSIELQNSSPALFQAFDEILQANTQQQVEEKISLVLIGIVRQMAADHDLNNVVQVAVDYIKANYTNNLNLQVIADQVNYSPSYLSFLFKQETGTNFIDYLNQYRIEQAKKLLRDTNDKNYEVAYQVGYQDEKYFYQIFKRYTGLTASQYRESFRLNKK